MRKQLITGQVSEVRISYHNRLLLADSPQITCSIDSADVLRANWSDDLELCETFNVLLLNRANRVKGMFTASKGGIAGTVVDPRIIFAAAVKSLSCSLILAHNHPSGNLGPSQADLQITDQMQRAGRALEIPVLDHIILTTDSYYSFADEGQL